MSKSEIVRFVVRFSWNATKSRSEKQQPIEWGWVAQLQEDALAVLRLAGTHQRLCELQCSWSGFGANEEAKLDVTETRLASIAGRLSMMCELQRDPRGATVRIGGQPVPANGFTAAQMNRMS